ncbi:TorF family putative porin [Marinobacter sp. HN1S83]|uniref:TorF family putative porin n=1 Tax=Marinobacter sp. HN1S83 TaxID=3382301 RepID=UPI00387B7EA1
MKSLWMAPACLLLSSAVTAAELSSTVSFTNDYRFRGISQTAGDAAVQGSIDVALDNGLYAGIWGSNVDFGDDANLEIDWYAGYWAEINDKMSWDATLYYYTYPGYDAADADYAEVDLNFYYGDLKLEYAFANDYVNLSEEAHYVALDYSYAVTDQVSLDLHAGHSFGDYWDEIDIGDYSDFSVGASTSLAGLDLSLAYLFNDLDSDQEIDTGPFRNDQTVLLTVSRSF